ncbi:hypothetical protein L7F22_021853 [Adiantum nelumboides]|nr:hypothetical protein [Adiantum nelumboides]
MASGFAPFPIAIAVLGAYFCMHAAIKGAVEAADGDPLQDFCIADYEQPVHVTGYACKPAGEVTVEDFIHRGLAQRASTANVNNATATLAFVEKFPALNSLGLSMARLDLDVGGIIPPHTHPRGSEIIFVIEGSLYAGFIDTSNKLFARVIYPGEVMLFPRGLIHFQLNVGSSPACAVVALNGQEPGLQFIANSMFGSVGLKLDVLQKAFLISSTEAAHLQSVFTKI